MQSIKNVNNIYFLGVCGTAMASLAVMLKSKGYHVSGSDEGMYPPMSTFLLENEIPVFKNFDPSHLNPVPDLVVIGNAISRGNVELEEILSRHIPYVSLPDALRDFFIRGRQSVVVAGTHGKTTTSSLIAWILDYAGRKPGFLIGGIPNNFGRGFQAGDGQEFVVEGDEYDSAYFDKVSKFLRYMPDIGVINNVEFDHADIFNSFDEIKQAFKRFINLIPQNGLLVACADYESVKQVITNAFCPVQTFGLTKDADWLATNIRLNSENTHFDVYYKDQFVGNITSPFLGDYNIRNTLAAIAVARFLDIDFETLSSAIAGFKGVMRRCELKGREKEIAIYDDFGHHPTAIKETLAAFRKKHPNHRLWALFEPRTATTRRNIFQTELVNAFDEADAVMIAPVDRPDKVPDGKILSTGKLAADLQTRGKIALNFPSVDDMVPYLLSNLKKNDVVITFSNGPFGNIHQKLLDVLKNN